MAFFSVIIPVYNAEKYLCRCIDSILKQSFQDYEVLLVDDASQDGSSEICEKLCKYNDKFKFEQVSHRGVSAVRNYAIMKALGRYLVFVDADDFIHADMLLQLYNIISTGENPDVCYMTSHYVITAGQCVINVVFTLDNLFKPDKNVSPDEFFGIVTKENNYVPGSTWLMVCEREFIRSHKILFDETIAWSEDCDFSYQILTQAENIKCCSFCGYYYYLDNYESASKKITKDKALSRMAVYHKWVSYFVEYGHTQIKYPREIREKIIQQLLSEYCQILCNYSDIVDKKERRIVKQKLQEERSLWRRCKDKRYKDYVKYGVVLGTMIQKSKRKIKRVIGFEK